MRARFAASFLLVGIGLGCLGKSEPTTSSSSAADAGAGDAAPGECTPQGDKCGPADACCGTVLGQRVHLAEGCAEAFALIACVPAAKPGDRCAQPDEAGCLTRELGGSQEVFVTSTLWREEQVPGFTACSSQLREEAYGAQNRACP